MHSLCHLRYNTPKEILVVFLNGSNYYDNLIIRDLAEEFEGQRQCLGENIETYTTFSVTIEKELENGDTVTYKVKFINSLRFMASSLLSLADTLADELHKIKCKYGKSCFDYMKVRDKLLTFKCLKCNKNHKEYFNKDL